MLSKLYTLPILIVVIFLYIYYNYDKPCSCTLKNISEQKEKYNVPKTTTIKTIYNKKDIKKQPIQSRR